MQMTAVDSTLARVVAWPSDENDLIDQSTVLHCTTSAERLAPMIRSRSERHDKQGALRSAPADGLYPSQRDPATRDSLRGVALLPPGNPSRRANRGKARHGEEPGDKGCPYRAALVLFDGATC